MSRTLSSLIFVLAACAAPALGNTLRAQISSQFLVQGEQAILEYTVPEDVDPSAVLKVRPVEGLNIRPMGFGAEPRLTFGRRREYVFTYSITSYDPGNYTIPPAVLDDGTNTVESPPVNLRIFRETDLQWSTVRAGTGTIRYAASFRTTDDSPFVKEVLPTELKLYFPAEQRVEDWGIPEFERDGVAAWRFEPNRVIGRANLLGRPYYAISFPSTLAPTRPGDVRLGPATLRLITVQSSFENFGSAFYEPVVLEVPPLSLEARDLPEGAPEGFDDAIGRFQLSVSAAETEIREGDPVTLTISVSGSGNLDTLDPPKPVSEDGWKLYPATPLQREDRRSIDGLVAFRQFMRPTTPQIQVPPFRLVYFDPESETYQTLISDPIPLDVLPSTNAAVIGATPPAALPMPVEQMTDILGVIQGAGRLINPAVSLPPWWWQVLPALAALALIGAALRLHVGPKLKRDPEVVARRADLRAVERAPEDHRSFFRAAGHFAERWLGDASNPLIVEILAKRDETCFQRDVSASPVPAPERRRILAGLRKLAFIFIGLAAFGISISPLPAEEIEATETSPAAAFEAGRFDDAARLWLESGPYERLSADTLYNIGNAAYRLGSPGEAALYWRRALLRDSTHPEARQNLRFMERKFGSISFKHKEFQYALAALPLSFWKNVLWASAWLALLGVLVFPATRRGARLRLAAVVAFVIAPLLAATGAVGWRYFPDEARFAPLTEQAVVVADLVNVRTDAARNSPLVIEAPAGSLVRLLTESGDWAYVAFTNDTRGWLPKDQVEPLIPDAPPAPPTRSRPSDTEKNA